MFSFKSMMGFLGKILHLAQVVSTYNYWLLTYMWLKKVETGRSLSFCWGVMRSERRFHVGWKWIRYSLLWCYWWWLKWLQMLQSLKAFISKDLGEGGDARICIWWLSFSFLVTGEHAGHIASNISSHLCAVCLQNVVFLKFHAGSFSEKIKRKWFFLKAAGAWVF